MASHASIETASGQHFVVDQACVFGQGSFGSTFNPDDLTLGELFQAANPAARGPTRWKSDRTLYDFPNGYGRNLVCDDTKRILESWSAQAHARGEANGFKNTGKGSDYSNGHSRNYNL